MNQVGTPRPLHFLEQAEFDKAEVARACGCKPEDLQLGNFGTEMRLDGRVVAVRRSYVKGWYVVGVHA